jgi:hypothetical protein
MDKKSVFLSYLPRSISPLRIDAGILARLDPNELKIVIDGMEKSVQAEVKFYIDINELKKLHIILNKVIIILYKKFLMCHVSIKNILSTLVKYNFNRLKQSVQSEQLPSIRSTFFFPDC